MKALLSALLLSTTSTPSLAADESESHVRLGETLSQFVDYRINPQECWEQDNVYGYYWSEGRQLVVCQTSMSKPDVLMPWSSADYDTLRHEAHHLIQDCIEGEQGDNMARPLKSGEELNSFVAGVLDDETVIRIKVVYSDRSREDVVMEIEAFAVASSMDADTISETIISVCSNETSS